MKRWLIEEREDSPMTNGETIRRHWIKYAKTAKAAMKLCGPELFFAPNELEEWVPGFAWAASDGSSVMYEVKDISD